MAQMVSVSTIMTKKNLYICMNSHARVDHLTKPGLRIWVLEDVFIHRSGCMGPGDGSVGSIPSLPIPENLSGERCKEEIGQHNFYLVKKVAYTTAWFTHI
jgi:hypothetical protein